MPDSQGQRERPWRCEENLRQGYVAEDKTTTELADDFGCSAGTVSTWLQKYGLNKKNKTKKLRNREWLKKKKNRGVQNTKIANKLGCTSSLVTYWIEKHGIEDPFPQHNHTLIKKLYVDRKLSIVQISREINSSPESIRQVLKEMGVKIRGNTGEEVPELRNEELLRKLYLEKEKSSYEIATIFNCHRSTVANHLRKYGIETRGNTGEKVEKLGDEDKLYRLYIQEEKTVEEIGDLFGCSSATVSNWLQRYGIESRVSGIAPPEELTSEERLFELHKEKGLCVSDIAEKYDCHRITVQRWAKRHGIDLDRPSGENHWNWKGGTESYYGRNWRKNRRKCILRDREECLDCGKTREEHIEQYSFDLHVHHVKKIKTFENKEEANKLENLRTLCVECHKKWEGEEDVPEPGNLTKHL